MDRWFVRALFLAAVAVLLAVGYLQGVQPLPLPWRVPEAAFAMLTFAGFILLSGGLFHWRLGRDDAVAPVDEPITAVVPTYRDAEVLERSVESLRQSTHPVEVVVVCEPDDERGIAVARRFARHDDVEYIVSERPGSKAGAINDAVARVDGNYFAVFDADQSVDPGMIARACGHLRANDVVQVRFVPEPTGVVESLSYYEYVLFNYCFRQPLYAVTAFRMATSKALFFTREGFERVDGYDPEVISEDYDFGHRCYLEGLDVKLVYDDVVREEATHSVGDWWGQRKRWMTGNVQVLHKLLGDVDLGQHRTYVSLGVGLASVGGAAFLVSLVPKAAWLAGRGDWALALAPVLAVYAVALPTRVRDRQSVGWDWLLVPFVLPFFSLITLMAVFDYLLDFDDEWFAVEKGGP